MKWHWVLFCSAMVSTAAELPAENTGIAAPLTVSQILEMDDYDDPAVKRPGNPEVIPEKNDSGPRRFPHRFFPARQRLKHQVRTRTDQLFEQIGALTQRAQRPENCPQAQIRQGMRGFQMPPGTVRRIIHIRRTASQQIRQKNRQVTFR